MKKNLLLSFFLLLNLAIANAQLGLLNEHPTAKPFSTAPSADFNGPTIQSGTLTDALNFAFDSITALTPIKGFNAAMLFSDGSLWTRAKGLSTAQPFATPLAPSHLMGMGSITKSFVATTLLILQEEGALDLDDSIGQYLPAYPNIPAYATVRQILNHRAGLNDYLNENPAMSQALIANLDSIWVADSILAHYVLAPNFPVNTSWSYSNTGYLLAGRIIEVVTGQPWYQVVREKILIPLGLTHTFAYPWESYGTQRFAHVFVDVDGVNPIDDWQGYGLSDKGLFSLAGSAGCLITTPEDLVRFSEQVHGGHFLQPASFVEMHTDHLLQPGSGYQYGLGTISYALPGALENWGHDGSLFYKSLALYFPEKQFSIAVQQNDDRLHDPADVTSPPHDMNDVFLVLTETYLNYSALSASTEPSVQLWEVQPNPAVDHINLNLPLNTGLSFPLDITIVNAQGGVVAQQSIQQSNELVSVSALPPGLFFVQAGNHVSKFVKR